ncbi:porin [Methylobacterium sp. JK268]
MTAAGLATAGAARAADLPGRKAAPVDYVRVCSTHGVGFFYIPGTDTCLRVGGRARFDLLATKILTRTPGDGDVLGYSGSGRLNVDSRTTTAYGTLRAFVRFVIASRTGWLTSGGLQAQAAAFPATGIDTAGRVQQAAGVAAAFIQFAGLTAGRADSFYDFYAHDFEINGATLNSDNSANLLAYTATFGNGFSATLSMEDPILRKSPIFGGGGVGVGITANPSRGSNYAPVLVTDAAGNPVGWQSADVVQRSRLPDFVGVLRYDGAWGAAQLSAAVHELNAGNGTIATSAPLGLDDAQRALLPARANPAGRVATEYGWAIQGGVKLNLPGVAANDFLYLQGAYGVGAGSYTGIFNFNGSFGLFGAGGSGLFGTTAADAVVDPVTGRLAPSSSFTAVASYLHYWSPEWRSAFFGSYGEQSYKAGLRRRVALFGVAGLPVPTTAAGAAGLAVSDVLRDFNEVVAGLSLIWSPVRDLDIGAEGFYVRQAVPRGRVLNPNKSSLNLVTASAEAIAAAPTVSAQDSFNVRFRVQRDF